MNEPSQSDSAAAGRQLLHYVLCVTFFLLYLIVADRQCERLSISLGVDFPNLPPAVTRLLLFAFMSVVPALEVSKRRTCLPMCATAAFTFVMVAMWRMVLGNRGAVQPLRWVDLPEALLFASPIAIAVGYVALLWLVSKLSSEKFRELVVTVCAVGVGYSAQKFVARVVSGRSYAHKVGEDWLSLSIHVALIFALAGLVLHRSGALRELFSVGRRVPS